MRRALWLTPLLLVFGACSGEGNTGQPDRNYSFVDKDGVEKKLWEQVPWANHATPQIVTGMDMVKISPLPVYPPIGANAPDPGSHPVDCSGLEDIELSPYYLDSFEPLTPTNVGMAPAWYSYDDGSDAAFRVPGNYDWYTGLVGRADLAPFGLAADRHDAHPGERPSCDGAPNDWLLHYRGGRFNYYGSGMAHPVAAEHTDRVRMQPLEHGCPPGSDLCPAAGADGMPNYDIFGDHAPFAMGQPHEFWDVSKYDGVVFWARRGPDGAPGALVALQNKYTADDLARGNEKYCKRQPKACNSACVNGYECIVNESINPPPEGSEPDEEYQLHRCMPPSFLVSDLKKMNPALLEALFPRCGVDTCKPAVFNPDIDFEGTQCNATEFTANDAGYWCSSKERPVAPYAERCGDGFVAPITLSTDWQLYKIPFDSFKQVGYGKVAPTFDLKSIYSVGFQFTVGYTDVYVDNVSFYRNK